MPTYVRRSSERRRSSIQQVTPADLPIDDRRGSVNTNQGDTFGLPANYLTSRRDSYPDLKFDPGTHGRILSPGSYSRQSSNSAGSTKHTPHFDKNLTNKNLRLVVVILVIMFVIVFITSLYQVLT